MRVPIGIVACAAAILAGLSASVFAKENPAPEAQPASALAEDANAQIAVIQAHMDAYRSGNIDRFVATFSKDAVVCANGYVAIGRDQIKVLYALNF